LIFLQDETGNGDYFGVSDFISGDHRNHVRLASTDVERGGNDADADEDGDAATGTTTELLEKQEMTVTLVTGERRVSAKNDVTDSPGANAIKPFTAVSSDFS